MENKKETYNEEDKLIKELFDSFSSSEPSGEFTKNTMNMVLQEWSSKPINIKTELSIKYKVLIGVASVIAIFLVYLFDIRHVADDTTILSTLSIDLEALNKAFGGAWIAFKKIPGVVYLVTMGLVALLFADKLINKLVNG